MTRAQKLYRFLGWFLALCGAAGIAYVFCGCGGAADSIARQAVRSAAYVVQSLCAPSATVTECVDTLLERAEYLDVDAGAQ